MKYAVAFTIFGITFFYFSIVVEVLLLSILLINISITFICVAMGYGFLGSKVFLKRPNGKVAKISLLLYWPYYLLNLSNLWLFRKIARENLCDSILPGLYLGSKPWTTDEKAVNSLQIKSVLDLTAEFA